MVTEAGAGEVIAGRADGLLSVLGLAARAVADPVLAVPVPAALAAVAPETGW
jgi:hypothetical protein